MIPQEKSAAVVRGLREAFGVTGFEDIRMITKGRTSALVYRIVVEGHPYLMRIITFTNTFLGPGRHFTCMRGAAEAGLAPHVWYTSIEDQISITDFVEEVPFPAPEALVRLPRVLRALHALPPFPKGVDYLDTSCMFLMHKGPPVDGFFRMVQEANVLSQGEIEELRRWHAEVAAIYPCHEADMVSSHNDLFKPDNILFDGERVWLVDWEAAFLNDRYADLAVVANLLVNNDEEERAYLEGYFGQPPDEYQLARFSLMRQVVHMFYAMAFLLAGSGEPAMQIEEAPAFKAVQRRMWTGELALTDKQTKTLYGRAHWEQLVEDMRQGRYREALRIVADRPAADVASLPALGAE